METSTWSELAGCVGLGLGSQVTSSRARLSIESFRVIAHYPCMCASLSSVSPPSSPGYQYHTHRYRNALRAGSYLSAPLNSMTSAPAASISWHAPTSASSVGSSARFGRLSAS